MLAQTQILGQLPVVGVGMSEKLLLVAIIGLSPFIGSFLGVLTVRLPQNRPVVWSRSRCDHCGHLLAPEDLFPVASWLWLRGRCRYCAEAIGSLPPTMEIAAILVGVQAATETSGSILLASCALGWTLLTLAVIDWRDFILPDALTLPLIPAGLIVAYGVSPPSLPNHALAAAAGLLGTILLAVAYRRLRGRDGLGLGDAKLLAGLGAWLGLDGLPTAILFAAMLGLIFVVATALGGRRFAPGDKIPLGTFLAAGGWLVWLYGPLVSAG